MKMFFLDKKIVSWKFFYRWWYDRVYERKWTIFSFNKYKKHFSYMGNQYFIDRIEGEKMGINDRLNKIKIM